MSEAKDESSAEGATSNDVFGVCCYGGKSSRLICGSCAAWKPEQLTDEERWRREFINELQRAESRRVIRLMVRAAQ